MLIANADRLTEIECHSPNLINTDLSECTKLQRIDLSDCTALGTGIGAQPILNIQNCKYLRYCNCMNTQLTAIYTMQAGGNLEEIYYPETTQVVQLTNQTYLHTIGLPSTNPCKNLADVQITNCNAIKTLSSETTSLDFNTLKYVQNLNITNSLSGLNSMQFNGFDKLRNVTLSSLKELDSIGFEDMMPVTTTSTLKNITISDCPLITSLSFNVSSDDYKVAFASNGKLDLGGLQSLKSIECNTSVKGLDTLIVPTSLTDLRFTTEYGDGINEIKNIWSASAVHNNDGFEGIDFQDMTIEFIDMLGLNGISNAINFHIAPKTQNPNLNTARDGSASKPWFHPIGSIDLSNYTGLMIGMLRGVDLNKLDVVINTDRDQVDLTSLFECATLPTAQNIVTKTNNILAKFPKSVIWDYMFKGCDLSFSPNDIRIPNRGLSLKGMYKDSNVTEDVSLPNVIMAVDEMFMNCTGITTYEENWLKTYSKVTYTVPTSNGTSGSWDDSGNYTEGTNYNQFLYTPSDGEKAFKIMTTGTGAVRINYFYNASFMSRIVYTPEFDSYPYVVTIPDGCNKVVFVCDTTIGFASEGIITTSNCYTNTGGALSEIPTSWGGYGLDKNVTSIYVIDTTLLTNTTTFNLVLNDNQAGITDWGDGVTNSEKSHTYAEHGVYTIKTKSWSNGTPSDDLKTALIEVKQIKLIGHNGNSKDYRNSFGGCTNLRKVTAYDLAPTNCASMFTDCSSLTELVGLDTWDMSNCTNISGMFYGTSITDPTPVYDMLSTFTGSSANSLFQKSQIESIEFGRFPSSITDFFLVANNCANLKTIDFTGVSNNISSLQQAFQACPNVTSIIGLETFTAPDGIKLYKIFANGTLRNISILDMSNLTCKVADLPGTGDSASLTTIKWAFDWSNISKIENYTWFNIPNATNYEFGRNIKADLGSNTSLNTMTKLTVNSLLNLFNALYDFSEEGGSHYIDIGSTNIAKLTREQMLIAIKKHWTIQGAPIQGVFRDTDISTLTSDNTVTAVAIELTADNYLTRIDEVLGVYTNAVDVYFFDDGSVTTLNDMCYNNNTATKDRIQNVTFIEGYFENCTRIANAFTSCIGLVTVTNIPNNITNMSYAFFNNTALTTVSSIPRNCTDFTMAFRNCTSLISVPTDGWTGNLGQTFQGCSSLNQQINIANPTGLSNVFYDCSSLTISPSFTGTYTGSIDNLFNGCSKLTNIVLPTTWRPSSAQNTFSGCTQLVTIENLDALDMSSCSNMGNMFFVCRKLSEVNLSNFDTGSCENFGGMFQACSSLIEIDVSSFDINNTNGYLGSMFQGCTSLISIIGLDKFNTSKVTSTAHMFLDCPALSELDLSNWDFSNISTITKTFGACTSLTKITLNNITDTSTREAGVGLRGALNTLPQPVEIVMDEFAMTDFSNLFQGVTK
ncbi:BspA family leucine-rich repeat surface protein, partial [Clostridium sp.]|uniref:BspA family leucine-rich repeat surface protein n=1 Tax=Clostridium sp. TaxID=1506 RepID=UPI0025BD5E5B